LKAPEKREVPIADANSLVIPREGVERLGHILDDAARSVDDVVIPREGVERPSITS